MGIAFGPFPPCSRPGQGPRQPSLQPGALGPTPSAFGLDAPGARREEKALRGYPSHSFILIHSFARLLFIHSFYKLSACPGAEPGNP